MLSSLGFLYILKEVYKHLKKKNDFHLRELHTDLKYEDKMV